MSAALLNSEFACSFIQCLLLIVLPSCAALFSRPLFFKLVCLCVCVCVCVCGGGSAYSVDNH